jgi:oligosaccharide repeat unit polymerase
MKTGKVNKLLRLISALMILSFVIAIVITYSYVKFNYASLFLISMVILIISLWFMQHEIGIFNLHCLTITGFWYFSYLAMILIPSFFVFFEQTNPARYRFIFAVVSVLVTVPIGTFLANILLKFKKEDIKRYFRESILENSLEIHHSIVYLMLLIGVIVLTLIYIREVTTIPVFYMIKNLGEYEILAELREESFKLLSSPLSYIYYVLRVLIYPFLIMVSFGYYRNSHKKTWFFAFILTFILGVLFASFSIAKQPVAAIFLIFFFFFYLYNSGKIKMKTIIIAISLIFAFPIFVVLSIQHGRGMSFFNLLSVLARRLFYVPSMVLYYYYEIFPDQINYLYGRSMRNLAWLMGKEYFNPANYVYQYIFPMRLKSGLANAAFIGNLNADFGIYGVLTGGVFAGFLMQSIQIYLLRKEKTVLNIAAYSFLLFAFWLLNSTALPTVILSNGVIFVLFLPGIIKITQQILRQATRKT